MENIQVEKVKNENLDAQKVESFQISQKSEVERPPSPSKEEKETEEEFKDTRESLDQDSSSQLDTSNRESLERDILLKASIKASPNSNATDNSLKSEEDQSNYEDIEEYESSSQLHSQAKSDIQNNQENDDEYEDYDGDEEADIVETAGAKEEDQTAKTTHRLTEAAVTNPALAPVKKGQFYEHDSRQEQSDQTNDLNDETVKPENVKEEIEANERKTSPDRWNHDKFEKHNNESSAQPKDQRSSVRTANYNRQRNNYNHVELQSKDSTESTDSNPPKSKHETSGNQRRIPKVVNKESVVEKQDSSTAPANSKPAVTKGLSLDEYISKQQYHSNDTRQPHRNNRLRDTNPPSGRSGNHNGSVSLKDRLDFSTRVPTILDDTILNQDGSLIDHSISPLKNSRCKMEDLRITTHFSGNSQQRHVGYNTRQENNKFHASNNRNYNNNHNHHRPNKNDEDRFVNYRKNSTSSNKSNEYNNNFKDYADYSMNTTASNDFSHFEDQSFPKTNEKRFNIKTQTFNNRNMNRAQHNQATNNNKNYQNNTNINQHTQNNNYQQSHLSGYVNSDYQNQQYSQYATHGSNGNQAFYPINHQQAVIKPHGRAITRSNGSSSNSSIKPNEFFQTNNQFYTNNNNNTRNQQHQHNFNNYNN